MAAWDYNKIVDLTFQWAKRYPDFYITSTLTTDEQIRRSVDGHVASGGVSGDGIEPDVGFPVIVNALNGLWQDKQVDTGHEAPRDGNGVFTPPPRPNIDDFLKADGTQTDPSDTSVWGRSSSPVFLKKSKAERDVIIKALEDAGFLGIIENYDEIMTLMKQRVLFEDWPTPYQNAITTIMGNPTLLGYGLDYFNGFRSIATQYNSYLKEQAGIEIAAAKQEASYSQDDLFESYLEAFFGPNAKAEGYQFAFYADTTRDKLGIWLAGHSRPDTTPASVLPWELRLGAARFSVPPINIDASQGFHTGSLTGGALRAKTSPKFNTGHMETMISMTLYFPTHETIWGFDGLETDFNWEEDTDDVIDEYLSSLRGLITQFRYAPILPIRNQYINSTLGVTAVALQSMSIQTVPDFPFCMQVQLNLLSFNHKVFLPMINDFHNAIHWGRYRQYMGRAAARMTADIGLGFLTEKTAPNAPPDVAQSDPTIPAPTKYPTEGRDGFGGARPITVQDINYDGEKDASFSKTRDLNNRAFDLYYPTASPLRVFAPDTQAWRQPYENDTFGLTKDSWAAWLGHLGVDVNTYPEAIYEVLKNSDQNYSGQVPSGVNTQLLLLEYLKTLNMNTDMMTREALDSYLASRRTALNKEFQSRGQILSEDQWGVLAQDIKVWWFRTMYNRYQESPLVRQYLKAREQQQARFVEWEIPMEKLGLDPQNVIVNGVSVGLSNNFSRMHLQMQAEPVYQHISGGDSTIDVSLTIFGEDDIIRLRRALEHVNGLARLEYAHGILGFVGVKNVITALAGIKYALPTAFEIETVPGFPRVYNVRLSFVDFDIYQQKREELSSDQQEEIVVAFGKRNPFLRIKQLWGCVDTETEIMTQQGWVRHDELNEGDVVLTLNQDSGKSEWQKCEAVNRYDVDTELLSLESKVHSSLTSSNHRWPVLHKDRLDGISVTKQWRTSETLNSNDYLIMAAESSDCLSHKIYSDAWVELVGWFWTEGSIRKDRKNPRVRIYQSNIKNPDYVARIREALTTVYGPTSDKLGDPKDLGVGKWREIHRSNGMVMFSLDVQASQNFVKPWMCPNRIIDLEFIRTLTLDQLHLLIEVSIIADGHERNGYKVITQSEKDRLVPIEYAAILAGYSTSLTETEFQYNGESRIRWDLRLRNTPTYNVPPKKAQKWVPYKGVIWCPTTPNGTWVAKRDGKTFFTGNSFNAYPDFPLGVYEPDHNDGGKQKLVGHLDPDFYFRSFQTIDDDLVEWNLNQRPSQAEGPVTAFGLDVEENFHKRIDDLAGSGQPEATPPPTAAETGASILNAELGGATSTLGNTPYTQTLYGKAVYEQEVSWALMPADEKQEKIAGLKVSRGDIVAGHWDKDGSWANAVNAQGQQLGAMGLSEDTANETLSGPSSSLPGLSPHGENSPAMIGSGYKNGDMKDQANDPVAQYEAMMIDAQYRNISGRMVRAFPTYMLWLIDETGKFAGVRLFDNFYGLQSVLDFSVAQSEDNLGDTLVLRLSNLYGKLNTQLSGLLGTQNDDGSPVDPQLALIDRKKIYGDFLANNTDQSHAVKINGIRIRPGVRVHLRAGYSANPNSLDTIFNGVITQVTQGEVVEVIGQSDAIELSPYVNTTDNEGDSGKIDGAFNTGLWMSEPRDLMVRLLSMGSSTFRENIAHATNGTIFSENRYGIRHFGQILYEPLTKHEEEMQAARHDQIVQAFQGILSDTEKATVGNNALGATFETVKTGGFDALLGDSNTRSQMAPLMLSLWTNFARHRDYELFKRNIYPGNGTGIAQYLGGDFPEAGLIIAQAAGPGVMSNSPSTSYPVTAEVRNANKIKAAEEAKSGGDAARVAIEAQGQAGQNLTPEDEAKAIQQLQAQTGAGKEGVSSDFGTNISGTFFSLITGIAKTADGGNAKVPTNPVFQMLGLQGEDSDLAGFEEVSFRAQTYMKSVWDLFQLCAALLPNYIVAVRPFEDRSTVFYGKPHWLYTSGVIPLTTGIPKDKLTDPHIKVDDERQRLLQEAADKANPLADLEERQLLLQGLGNISPTTTPEGMPYKPTGTIESLSNISLDKKAKIPVKSGKAVAGWHLPIGPNHEDQLKHVQVAGMPSYLSAPANFNYVKGFNGTLPKDPYLIAQNLADPGDTLGQPRAGKEPEPGAFGYFNQPNLGLLDEQWYISMRWPYKDFGDNIGGQNPFANHKQEDYRSRKVTVLNTRTGKAVVCSIADEGAPQYGDIVARLSPDTWHTLGCTENDTIFFGFAADSTRIGPLTDAEASTLSTVFVNSAHADAEAASGVANPPSDDTLDVRGGVAGSTTQQNRIAIYGSNIQAFDLGYDGTNYSVFEVKGGANNYDFKSPQREDVVGHLARRLYDREYDKYWKETMKDSDLADLKATGHGKDEFKSMFDKVFDLGSLDDLTKVKANNDGEKSIYTLLVANDIWNDFRTLFHFDNQERVEDKTVGDYVTAVYADPQVNMLLGGNVASTGPNTYEVQSPTRDQGKAHEVLVGFKRWLWQNAYGRAWLVNAAQIQTQWFSESNTLTNFFDNEVVKKLTLPEVGGVNMATVGNDLIGKFDSNQNWHWNFVQGSILEAWKQWVGMISRIGDDWQSVMFDDTRPDHAKYDRDFMSWLEAHAEPGTKSKNPLDAQKDNLNQAYKNTVGRLLGIAGDSLQGLLASFRLELNTMGMGLDMVGLMQKQAHVMNKVFNDSIYYGAGTNPNSLLRLADNPFTREYGEPVIEIRQPFQRMHYIDSFQHILNNGIQENLSGVSTVVTASSDGKYPVTVYFDKGISSERQIEKAVETGLFWDNARGAGFFSFLHPLLHPVEMMRGVIKTATGSSDELLSKRVALWHLKESLKDIYSGEIIILGNPSIRPHDLVYIADVSERVYGMFEVEQVVHTFTPEEGFISSITPNAIVTINDPGRWSMISWVQSMFANKNIRDDTRSMLKVWADDSSEINRSDVAVKDLASALSTQILGHTMYTHGSSALVKDIMSARGTGLLLSKAERIAKLKEIQENAANKTMVPFSGGSGTTEDLLRANSAASSTLIPGAGLVQDMLWSGWDWVRDNLLDQHGCYIQYLNKDGVAMDAGLSYAQGVAVGRHHSISLLPGILGINVPTNENGNARITVNDQLSQLGWTEIEITKQYKFTSWWESRINAEILKLSGHTIDPLGLSGTKIIPYAAKLNVDGLHNGIIDGDTIEFLRVDGNGNSIDSDPDNPERARLRMAGVDAAELASKHNLDYNRLDDPGLLAWQFAKKRLYDDPIGDGYDATFVVRPANGPLIRINGKDPQSYEHFGRPIGVIFHNVPLGTPAEKRVEVLMKQASQWPMIEWDSYMDDGRPYTFNWEMIMHGHSQTNAYDLTVTDYDRGAIGIPR